MEWKGIKGRESRCTRKEEEVRGSGVTSYKIINSIINLTSFAISEGQKLHQS